MNLQKRIDLLIRLGEYILSDEKVWQDIKLNAAGANNWFIPEFIDKSVSAIAANYLDAGKLTSFVERYHIPQDNVIPKIVGLVMAGNIPLVGFHDLLCIFLSGHRAHIKVSSKDEILITHLADKLMEWEKATESYIRMEVLLKGCDAYIATGSNNSGRYFDYYFAKYAHIIRRNKTSVAILTGKESDSDLEKLADDVHFYFGLGCRNVTKIFVPEKYDFVPLLEAFRKFAYFSDHHKYKNNLDYQLAIYLLNNKFYMTNGSVLLLEDKSVFSPISQVNYEYYTDGLPEIDGQKDIQCIIGAGHVPFGEAQCPSLTEYADGVDTIQFLLQLK